METLILRKSWLGVTYTDIATSSEYGEHYLRKTASELWRTLSKIFGISITKVNLRQRLENRVLTIDEELLIEAFYNKKLSENLPPFPGSPVPVLV